MAGLPTRCCASGGGRPAKPAKLPGQAEVSNLQVSFAMELPGVRCPPGQDSRKRANSRSPRCFRGGLFGVFLGSGGLCSAVAGCGSDPPSELSQDGGATVDAPLPMPDGDGETMTVPDDPPVPFVAYPPGGKLRYVVSVGGL